MNANFDDENPSKPRFALANVRVAIEDGKVIPIATSGASILSSTVRASGCVIVERAHEGMPEGAIVEVRLYDDEPPAGTLP